MSGAVDNARPVAPTASPKKVQMVFCIDVRSEIIRRHLETIAADIETLGFAGFLGLSLEYLPLGATSGTSQCPVLLTPGFRVQENLLGADDETQVAVIERRSLVRLRRKIWKSFQSSAASCFSFVESMGLAYSVKLVTDAFRFSRPVNPGRYDGISAVQRSPLGPDLQSVEQQGLSLSQQITLAEGMLRNPGADSGLRQDCRHLWSCQRDGQ